MVQGVHDAKNMANNEAPSHIKQNLLSAAPKNGDNNHFVPTL